MSGQGRNSGPVTFLWDGHQGNTSHQSCSTTVGNGRPMCLRDTQNLLTQEETILAHQGLSYELLPKKDHIKDPFAFNFMG